MSCFLRSQIERDGCFGRKKGRDNLPWGSVGGLGPFPPVSRKSPPFLQSRPKNVTESGRGGRVVKISLPASSCSSYVWSSSKILA